LQPGSIFSILSEESEIVVFEVAKFTRVCAYDRSGTPVGEKPSRSDPVPQPTTAGDAVADLHALLTAAGEVGPFVLVGHSYGGLVARLYASIYPEEVCGLVLVDALGEGLRDAETPEQWAIQRKLMEGDIRESLVWSCTRPLKGSTWIAALTRSAQFRHCVRFPWSCCLRTDPGGLRSGQ
jgi:pimeloyl-ACP methyl ester carboxylesterase